MNKEESVGPEEMQDLPEEKEMEEKTTGEHTVDETGFDTPEDEQRAEPDATEDKIAELEEQVTKYKDDYMRLYADFENFRRRNSKERLELIAHSNAEMLTAILPVLDDMERAIKINEESTDAEAIKDGFKLVYQKLNGIAQSKGLRPMDSLHKEFNDEYHEAVTNVPVEDKKFKGKVIDVVEKGYTLNDKIIRHAKVVIGS